ncbi:hypothetical protein A3C37_01845 [Candidatus Peribacteria bacterium RIFCSPHIGHO2_02_FULL_53_20]|nr:MAG: hypothetical protein A3C37_01845 [Candidatus Peribacteria bacterium RIFCSPHIGHO2_02_FULL_53_20]
MTAFLTPRLEQAMELAIRVHGPMKRKGDDQPYLVHPMSVLALLVQWGSDEDTCIAGLLHDVIEDAEDDSKRAKYRKEIEEKFGREVLEIVEGVTEQDKSLPWKERKMLYLKHLKEASEASLLVSCADRTHNMSSLVESYRNEGEEVWKRFNAGKEQQIWFVRSVFEILHKRLGSPYTEDLEQTMMKLENVSAESSVAVGDDAQQKLVKFTAKEFLKIAEIAKSFVEKGTADNPPKFVIMTGGPGAGKSTIRKRDYSQGYVHFDPGDIFAEMRKIKDESNVKFNASISFTCELLLRQAIEERKNIVTEVIGDTYEPLKSIMDKMLEIGYTIDVRAVTADVAESYQRHLKAVKEDPGYLSAALTQGTTLSTFSHVLEIEVTGKKDRTFQKTTPEKYLESYNTAVEAARGKIRTGKDDLEKQKTCPHDFDSLIGDLLHGPCVCSDCGKAIAN